MPQFAPTCAMADFEKGRRQQQQWGRGRGQLGAPAAATTSAASESATVHAAASPNLWRLLRSVLRGITCWLCTAECSHARFCESCAMRMPDVAAGCPVCRDDFTVVMHIFPRWQAMLNYATVLYTIIYVCVSKTFSLHRSDAPQTWNGIRINIRISPSVSSFKRNLKIHYIAAAFSPCHVPPVTTHASDSANQLTDIVHITTSCILLYYFCRTTHHRPINVKWNCRKLAG